MSSLRGTIPEGANVRDPTYEREPKRTPLCPRFTVAIYKCPFLPVREEACKTEIGHQKDGHERDRDDRDRICKRAGGLALIA